MSTPIKREEIETLMKTYKKKVRRYPFGYTIVGMVNESEESISALFMGRKNPVRPKSTLVHGRGRCAKRGGAE